MATGRSTRRAFTLTEVGLAILILALAIVPIVDVLLGSQRRTRQTSDFGLAMAVADKVAEELRLANWEDARLTRQLEADSSGLSPGPVVDGMSPFFRAIEDSGAPFGRLRSGEDTAITTRFPALHRQLMSFRVGAAAKPRSLETTGEVMDLRLSVDWSDFRSQRTEMSLGVTLARPGSPASTPQAMTDRDRADAAIRETLFPDRPARTLEQVTADIGATIETVRDLGDVVVVVSGMVETDRKLRASVEALTARVAESTAPSEKAKTCLELARLYESRASAYLWAVLYLSPVVGRLASTFDPVQLGTPPVLAGRYRPAFAFLPSLRAGFLENLAWAREVYTLAYGGAPGRTLRPRVRVRIFMKVVSLYKLELLAGRTSNLKPLRTALVDFMEYHEGRNPNFFGFAAYELEHSRDLEGLRASYAHPDRIAALEVFRDEVPKAIRRVSGS